ncbi:Unknown protein [Striga hermonthica]|uniref:BHLH domain-containing protein n=1 Tax=Striga hermonthica TaxID=68872 RepID=A0A9N7MS56_STRHE|nr:Unknown protein [Striga hermonthica]
MFTANDSQTFRQLSAPKLPVLDRMARVQLGLNSGLPHFKSSSPNANIAFQEQTNSYLQAGEFFNFPPQHWNIPYSVENSDFRNSQNVLPHGLGISEKPVDPSHSLREKKFLIFDRSGNHTTYMFSPSFYSPQNVAIASGVEKVAARADKLPNPNSLFEEKWDENYLNDNGEDELIDDSEEINALLDSDSDDDDDDDDDDEEEEEEEEDNDEVNSTMNISLQNEGRHDKEKLFDGLIEEVASCDCSPKRLRLPDGGYKKLSSSSVNLESSVSSCNYENDFNSSKRDKKVKIRETLKILESLVPGLESNKDPVTIIEKAIVYLESMKTEAEALGLTRTESELSTHS